MRHSKKFGILTATLTMATVLFASSPVLARAQGPMPPPGMGPGDHPGMMGPRMHGRRHVADFRELNLSDAQREAIRKIFKHEHKHFEALGRSMRDQHEALHDLDPRAPGYKKQVDELAKEAAELARDRVELMADVQKRVDMQLTKAQRTKLKTMRREEAERRAERLQRAAERARKEAKKLENQ